VSTYSSRIGLQGNPQRLLHRSPGVRVHLGHPVGALSASGGWFVHTPTAATGLTATS
jgi:hypothetical protein